MTLSFKNIADEILMVLRNSDILSISVRGVTTKTDSFTATAGQTIFTLTNTRVKNVRTITKNSVAIKYLRDYTINFETGVLTLLSGATLNDSVSITYDYGASDKIYSDMPRDDLTLQSFPRISIELTSSNTNPLDLGGMSHLSDFLITIYLWVPANKESAIAGGIGGTQDIRYYLGLIRDAIRTNSKSFYSFNYITPFSTSPLIKGTNNKILQMSEDFKIKFVVE